jgi:anti-sigma-K factor RskA
MRHWSQSLETVERLAGEYALGTLAGRARRRFEAVMHAHPAVARAAAAWDRRLAPLAAGLGELGAGEALWRRIEQRAFGAPSAASRRPSWWQRLFAPLPAGALAAGLTVGAAVPLVWQVIDAQRQETQLPESYVGVLATADGKPGLIVSSLRRGDTVDLKPLARVAVPAGSRMVLWTLDAQGVPQAVGALPPLERFASMKIAGSAEVAFQRAVELAVSIEAAGSLPVQPTLPYVYRGLCGKLWPVKPAPSK